MDLPELRIDNQDEAAAVKARLCRESRLIARLMRAEPPALHDECETLGLPHEGRSPGELRAALFNALRRRPGI
ncbi:MAG: hypothetical protein QM766_02090 [Burkholderiaceae bacterium]